jgi:DNA-binding LacI/PurR family transcriptional regulator
MSDVAVRAGVSPATVSRALRGHTSVSALTRDRVLRAAAELRYVVSPAASGLVTGRTGTVGVVAPEMTRWYYARVVAGAGQILHDHGLDLLLHSLGDAAGRSLFFDRMPLSRRVDAILFLSIGLTPAEMERLRGLHVPMIFVGAGVSGCWSARIDDVSGAAKAVSHLVNLGHRDIGLISSTARDGYNFTAPVDRAQGAEQAIAEAGIPWPSSLRVAAPWGVPGGAAAMAELLTAQPHPTAVFAESDELAFGALQTLRRAGVRVPDDVSVIGFDDHEMADLLDLTTVAQPVQELGAWAARLLIEAMERPDATPRSVVLPTRLVVRATTGPPRPRRT